MEKSTSQKDAAKALGKSMRMLFQELSFPDIEKKLCEAAGKDAAAKPEEMEAELMELAKLRPAWEKEIAEEALSYSPEELLRRRLDLFKGCEKTIQSYRASREKEQWPEALKELIGEYDDCRRQAMLRVWAATRTRREEKLPDSLFQAIGSHVAEVLGRGRETAFSHLTLSSLQLQRLTRLERWLIRHYPEGEKDHVRNAQGELIRRLLAERKAIRLLVFYLAETQAEEFPGEAALQDALAAYVPDTERFHEALFGENGKNEAAPEGGLVQKLALAYRKAICIASCGAAPSWFALSAGLPGNAQADDPAEKPKKRAGRKSTKAAKPGRQELEIFDTVFRMDELTDKIFALKNKEQPEPFDPGLKGRMKEQLRVRAAAAAGFSALQNAAEYCREA